VSREIPEVIVFMLSILLHSHSCSLTPNIHSILVA
jgi:hypothetical protein